MGKLLSFNCNPSMGVSEVRPQKIVLPQIGRRRAVWPLKGVGVGAPSGGEGGQAVGLDVRRSFHLRDFRGQPTHFLHEVGAEATRQIDDLPQSDGRRLRMDREEAEHVDPVGASPAFPGAAAEGVAKVAACQRADGRP